MGKHVIIYCFMATCISISWASKPILKDKSADQKVASGGSLTLSCQFSSDPEDGFTFSWQKDNKDIKYSNHIFVNSLSNFQKILTVNNVQLSDGGQYTCIGKNNDGTTEGNIDVSLLDFKPIIADIPDVYIKQGEDYTIVCSASGLPEPQYTWQHLSQGSLESNVNDLRNGKLVITNMEKNNEGVYTCIAKNSLGETKKETTVHLASGFKFVDTPEKVNITGGDEYSLTASVVSLEDDLKFSWVKDGNIIDSTAVVTRKEGARFFSTLFFESADVSESGTYQVNIPSKLVSGLSRYIQVTVYSKPIVEIPEGKFLMVKKGETAEFVCAVKAFPQPEIMWLKNGTVLFSSKNSNITAKEGQSTLIFKISDVSIDNEGEYSCVAKNSLGRGSSVIKLDVKGSGGDADDDDDGKLITVIVVLSVIAILIIIIAAFIYIKYKEQLCGTYDYATGTFYTDLNQQEKDCTLADLENNPYAIKKNINISIKMAGRSNTATMKPQSLAKGGSFAQSLKRAGRISVKSPTAVENNYAPLDSVVSQGKALEFKHIIFDEILGEGEYGCVTGGRLLDEDDPSVYTDVSIKMLRENASPAQRRDMLTELRMMRRIARHKHVVSLIGWCITDDNVYVLEEYVPFGSLLTFLRSNRLLSQSEENLEQISEEDRVSQSNLLTFALQISNGMEHLSQLQIVHRDLACRNVYIGHEKICKISDYGLARDIYTENVYRKLTGGQLPVRWMAYECVFQGDYSVMSDVWSFGILLWELCTLGKIPYPGIVRTEQLLDELEAGYHMENPGHISTDLYLLMNSCWNRTPESRPSFSALSKSIKSLLEDNSEVHIDLTKLFETEFQDESEDILSPTSDFHRLRFDQVNEEDDNAIA